MKIAVFSKNSGKTDENFVLYVVNFLKEYRHEVLIHDQFAYLFPGLLTFADYNDLKENISVDFLFSLGGDGTFLDAAGIIADLNIPLVGINTGRIGFLTGINKNDFACAFDMLRLGHFDIEERALLKLEVRDFVPDNRRFALNDITIHSSGGSYLNTINVWIDGQKVNTYWADGLIVSTPTGSTAYSLSCGGPIIMPSASVNVITPIASHSLSVRPIVVPDEGIIEIDIEGRSKNFILSYDSHRMEIPNPASLIIRKEDFVIKTVRFNSMDFFSVIREKLMWGLDRRNEGHEETD